MYSIGILKRLRYQFYAQIAAEVQWEIRTQLKTVFFTLEIFALHRAETTLTFLMLLTVYLHQY